jgi:hypothetical protein
MDISKITLGDVATAITLIASIIGGCIYLKNHIKEWIASGLDGRFTKLENKIDNVDMNSTKNYLTRFLSDLEKGETPSEIELERFYEQYDHYISNKGNTYIKARVERLQKDGKIIIPD